LCEDWLAGIKSSIPEIITINHDTVLSSFWTVTDAPTTQSEESTNSHFGGDSACKAADGHNVYASLAIWDH
jgi:hypothetical protein